jgi:hypothetical protein
MTSRIEPEPEVNLTSSPKTTQVLRIGDYFISIYPNAISEIWYSRALFNKF